MIADNRIERDSHPDNLLPVHIQDLDSVPAYVTQHKSHGSTVKPSSSLSHISDRLSCELSEMSISMSLRVRHRNYMIIVPGSCTLELKIKPGAL